MLEDADRKLKKDFTQKLKTSFGEGGRGQGRLTLDRECSWQLTTRIVFMSRGSDCSAQHLQMDAQFSQSKRNMQTPVNKGWLPPSSEVHKMPYGLNSIIFSSYLKSQFLE